MAHAVRHVVPPAVVQQISLLLAVLVCLGSGLGPAVLFAGIEASATFQVSLSATPSYGAAPLAVAFQASVTSGTPTGFNWSFGDGALYNGTNASGASPTHTYVDPGTFTVHVTVFEGTESGAASIEVHVVPSALTVRVGASVSGGRAPLTVAFTSQVSGGTGTYINYSWDFGDGGLGSGSSIRYTYLHPGTFHAVLTVFDSGNASAVGGAWINVTSAEAPRANLWALAEAVAPWIATGVLIGVVVAWSLSGRPVAWHRVRSEPTQHGSPTPASQDADSEVGPTGPAGPGIGLSGNDPSLRSIRDSRSPQRSRTLLISQRVILQLFSLGRLGSDDVAPIGFTQRGLSEDLDLPQNTLTNVLRRLVAAGILVEDTRHVMGRDRRLKVYRLTTRGEGLARDLWRRNQHR